MNHVNPQTYRYVYAARDETSGPGNKVGVFLWDRVRTAIFDGPVRLNVWDMIGNQVALVAVDDFKEQNQ